jgi:pimeloyl-ACP methyl ester carboxylesterase
MNYEQKLLKKLLKYERQVFECVGLRPHEYFQSVENVQPTHYLKFGDPKNTAILLVHGYGGSAINFFRIIPELMKHFFVIAIDLLGFGASDRPEYKFDKFDRTIGYFTTSIVTLLNFLNIRKVILIGHSMGAFICSHLTLLIKERVIALFLVGAAGFTSRTFTKEEFEVMFAKVGKWYAVPMEIVKIFDYLTVDQKIPLLDFVSKDIKYDLVTAYFEDGAPYLNREEKELFVRYYKVVHELGSCGHNAIFALLKYGSYSEYPIIKILQENPDILAFMYYGELEWLDIDHYRMELNRHGLQKNYRLLKGCGHQVFMQSPTEFLQMFYQDYKSVIKDQES